MDVVSYEFFEYIGNGGVVYYFVDEGVNIDGIKGLGEIYCYECCFVWRSFLIKSVDYWVYY